MFFNDLAQKTRFSPFLVPRLWLLMSEHHPRIAGASDYRKQLSLFLCPTHGDGDQINFIPRSDACPSRPTMMWSWTARPNVLATAMISSVILMSWVDGVGSPDG
jgi:hypothetical protein